MTTEAVFNIWKNFAEELNEALVMRMSLMMCKKCFSTFERYHTLAKLIINNMKKALSVLNQDVELPAIKKPRLDFDVGRESFPSSSSSVPPGGVVSIFLLYIIQQLDTDMHVIYRFMLDTKIPRLTYSHLNARYSERQWQEEATSKLQRNA